MPPSLSPLEQLIAIAKDLEEIDLHTLLGVAHVLVAGDKIPLVIIKSADGKPKEPTTFAFAGDMTIFQANNQSQPTRPTRPTLTVIDGDAS